MKLSIKRSIFFLVLLTIVVGCEESDKFSSDPSLQLELSRDIVGFDTVFTTLASPIQQVKIYNRNNNSIAFESIELVNADKSGFRINVDGQGGTKFEDIDILRKDSIYIMIDAKLNETVGKDILVRDSIRIKWNGNTKYIHLGAYGLNANIWDDKTIDTNTTLSADKGYYVRGNMTVNEGVTLQIEEGTAFYFDRKGSLTINGIVVAKGTTTRPIVFRGHRFDNIDNNIPYDNAPDQWMGITVGSNSFNNVFENVRIRNAQKGLDFASSQTNILKASLVNTIIHNTSIYGLRAINSKIDAVNCQFSNSRGVLVQLIGGSYSFLHCTIANYYAWHNRTSSALALGERAGNATYPLIKCNFENSIIVGSMRNEISTTIDALSYKFNTCVIQTSAPNNGPQYVGNTIWNINAPFLFKELNSNGRYFYSFELPPNSSAIGAGSLELARQAPLDLRGVSRLVDGKPDIGCYEWTK